MHSRRVTAEEDWEPTKEARRALANPLQANSILRLVGPAVDRNSISHGREAATFDGAHPPNKLRSANEELLEAVRSEEGRKGLSFELGNALRVGHLQVAPVWSAEARLGGRRLGSVVLKIVAAALYPPFPVFGQQYLSTVERVSKELCAYSALLPLQGRDVPHCYGAYPFDMPWGEQAVGFVLEDLLEVSEPLWRFVEREKERLRSVEALHLLIRPSFHQLHRLHRLNVGHVRAHVSDIFVLRGSTIDAPRFVFCGLSMSERADESRPAWEEWDPEGAAPYEWADEEYLKASWGSIAPSESFVGWGAYSLRVEPDVWTKELMTRSAWSEKEAARRVGS